MYIYEIRNLITNVSYYGQSSQRTKQRVWTHRSQLRHGKHSNSYLQNAWNKYGEDAFEFRVLFDDVTDKKLLNEIEQQLIRDNPSYNLTSGGEGFSHTDETKKKLKDIQHNRLIENPELRSILTVRVNSWRTEKSMKAFSEKCRRYWQSSIGKKIHSEASKKVWSDASRRENLSNTHKERIRNNPEELDRLKRQSKVGAEKAKLVRQKTYDGFISPSGEVFESVVNLNEFCRTHGLDSRLMHMVNSGKRIHHKGWKKLHKQKGI